MRVWRTHEISPSGEYYAATVPLEDSTALTLFRRADFKVVAVFRPRRNAHVNGFEWVSDDRVLAQYVQRFQDAAAKWDANADCPAQAAALSAIGDACEACHRDYR